jgi:hypothetical protein
MPTDARQLRKEREERIMNAIKFRKNDRVPVDTPIGYFPARVAGIPCSAAYYDYDAWYKAYDETIGDYPADMIFVQGFQPGSAMEILQPFQSRWPGFNTDPNHGHQSVEIDNMKDDEYGAFLEDPSDYCFRVHTSRTAPKLAGLARFPRLSELHGFMGANAIASALAEDDVALAIQTLRETGLERKRWRDKLKKFDDMVESHGFPRYFQGAWMPPFNLMSHSIRGMEGTMKDIFRQPDNLIAACEKILEIELKRPNPAPSENGYTRIFMTNTRGSDDFMSTKHFDKFYWPTFRKLVHALIDRGMTPCIFFEGNFTSRLEYLKDFPKGSICAKLDTTDIHKAKKVLGDHICFEGNVPSSLLQIGTVAQVKEYCKRLIEECGEGGGFILAPRSSTDEVKPENLRAMIDCASEYGAY